MVSRRLLFGIGYHEIGRVVFKLCAVQLPFVLLWLLSASALIAYVFSLPVLLSLAVGLKIGCTGIAARICLLVVSFSSLTNDTSRSTIRTLAFAAMMMVMVLLTGGSAVVSFVPYWWGFLGCLATVTFAVGFYFGYGSGTIEMDSI